MILQCKTQLPEFSVHVLKIPLQIQMEVRTVSEPGYADAEDGLVVEDEALDYRLDRLEREVESGGLPGEDILGQCPVDDQYSADSL